MVFNRIHSSKGRSVQHSPIYKKLAPLAGLGLALSGAAAANAQGAVPLGAGDPNGDRLVNVTDAVLVLQASVGIKALTEAQQAAADINADGKVNVNDAIAILSLGLTLEKDAPVAPIFGSARFVVDAQTGKVAFDTDALSGPKDGPFSPKRPEVSPLSAFMGSAVDFETDTLIDQPGNTGRKVLQVSLVNRSGEPMGRMPDGTTSGIKVIFNSITNLSAYTDLRSKTLVETLAGSGTTGSGDGPAPSAALSPTGLAFGPDGSLYAADFNGKKIRKIKNGQVSTLAGSGTEGTANGSGSAASFKTPYGIAYSAADGSLYVADVQAHQIRRVTSDGSVTTVAGTGAAGGTNGAGQTATFNNPVGIAVAADGTIYVSEMTGNRIRKIKRTGADPLLPSSYTVSTFAGSGIAGFADGNGAASAFNSPRGIAVDGSGVLYVADGNNHRIRRITPLGEVATIAGKSQAGSADGNGLQAAFNIPQGIAVVGDGLAVADTNSNRLRQLTLKDGRTPAGAGSWQVQTLAGTGMAGSLDKPGNEATFNQPLGLAADGSNNVYVADYTSRKVRKVIPSNGIFPVGVPTGALPTTERVRLANADGYIPRMTEPYLKYSGVLEPGQVSAPEKWAFIVPKGITSFEFTLVVEAATDTLAPPPADVNAASPDVWVHGFAGDYYEGFMDGPAPVARFAGIRGVAADRAGNLFVSNHHSIRRVSADGTVTTIAGLDQTTGTTDGPGTLAKFNVVHGLAVTPDGKILYAADHHNHTIRRLALTGSDPALPENWTVSTVAGLAGTAAHALIDGQDNTTGDAARFEKPTALALDAGGNLYVTEYYANRIRVVRFKGGNPVFLQNWHVRLISGAADGSSGNVDGVALTGSARYNGPHGITVDPNGSVWVADMNNHRIRRIFDPAHWGIVETVAGSTAGYADGTETGAQFNFPMGIASDSAGYVYVTDNNNHRVRRISPGGEVATVAGSGERGAVDGAGNAAKFDFPAAIAVDPSGSLYVSDSMFAAYVRLIQRVVRNGVP